VRRDDTEALRWYKFALRQGNICAPNNIATIYRDSGNERRAMFWFRRAIASGDGDALVEVGRRLYKGIGVRCNVDQAVRHLRKAIASKNITQAGREEARELIQEINNERKQNKSYRTKMSSAHFVR
jgi:TPR repeat protein